MTIQPAKEISRWGTAFSHLFTVHLYNHQSQPYSKGVSVEFIARQTRADGIITTKPALVRRAKELGIFAVLRFFVIDSLALKNIENLEMQCGTSRPDFIEVLPGVMPKVLGRIAKVSRIPMIAGGLITEKEDVIAALSVGAIAVSSTNQDVWKL